MDVVRHIKTECPDTNIHLVPAGGSEETSFVIQDLSCFKESMKEIFEIVKSLKSPGEILSYSLAERILVGLKNKEHRGSSYICDAGIGTLSVSIEGDIYPCFMFTDQDDMRIGNINDIDILDNDKSKQLYNKISSFSVKKNNEECKNCFINSICNGCLGLNAFYTDNPFKLSKKSCDMFREMTEVALIEYSKMPNDLSEQKELQYV